MEEILTLDEACDGKESTCEEKLSSRHPNGITEKGLRTLATAILHPRFKEMSGNAFKNFATMLLYDQGNGIWASQKTLGEFSGISQNTTKAAIHELNEIGFIKSEFVKAQLGGRRFRGKKHTILLKEIESLVISFNREEWSLSDVGKDSVAFLAPTDTNISYFLSGNGRNVPLPPMELILSLLHEYENDNHQKLTEIIQSTQGIPTRLFGFMLALYLGDPWSCLVHSKRLQEWDTKLDDYVYENTLAELHKKEREYFRERVVRNRSVSFKKLLQKNQKNLKKLLANEDFSGLSYIFNHKEIWGKLFPCPYDYNCACHPQKQGSILCCYGKQKAWDYKEFVAEGKLTQYIPGKQWIETAKGLSITKVDHSLLGGFIGEVMIPLLVQVNRVVREADPPKTKIYL